MGTKIISKLKLALDRIDTSISKTKEVFASPLKYANDFKLRLWNKEIEFKIQGKLKDARDDAEAQPGPPRFTPDVDPASVQH